LTAEQKQKCLDIATLPKQRFDVDGQAFLRRILAVDETWVRSFELELKSQSNEWRSPSSPWPKKFRRAQSNVKQMIFAYDRRGIIMTDRVPCGTSVTATYNRDFMQKLYTKMHKTDLTCSGMGHSFCTTMHASTWGRLWPICWVNTSGKCYLTCHTVRTWVHQTSTYSPSWNSPCVGSVFPPWKSFLQRLSELSEPWTKVVPSVE
jgi:hypothetical protein